MTYELTDDDVDLIIFALGFAIGARALEPKKNVRIRDLAIRVSASRAHASRAKE